MIAPLGMRSGAFAIVRYNVTLDQIGKFMTNSRNHGPWIIHETTPAYRDAFVDVRLDKVTRPDGNPGRHVVVQLKPGVCVLAIDEQNQVHLTQEFHYGIGRDSIEAVSGGIEPEEIPLECAKRELQEEIGLQAGRWEWLTTIDPFTTVVVSPTQLYLARELTEVPAAPDGTERIQKIVMPLEEAIRKIKTGQITHAPTCVLLLLASRWVSDDR
jgi:ADP-ribose pyrophosphatase